MRRFLCGLAGALLWFGQADAVPAAWGNVYGAGVLGFVGNIAKGGSDSPCGSSVSETTTVTAPTGSLILVWVYSTGNHKVGAVNDDVSNTYNELVGDADINGELDLWYSFNSTALPSGDHIILSPSSGTLNTCYMIASAYTDVSSISPLDQTGKSTATGTHPSIASGVLNSPTEAVVGAVFVTTGQSDSFTEASGFTTDSTLGGGLAPGFHSAYEFVSTTSSVTYAPTLGTSRLYNALLATFISAQ